MIDNYIREYINGVMEGDMKGIGNKIKCMGKELILGKMGENMKGNIFSIRNK